MFMFAGGNDVAIGLGYAEMRRYSRA
jgi:hypothetical protein